MFQGNGGREAGAQCCATTEVPALASSPAAPATWTKREQQLLEHAMGKCKPSQPYFWEKARGSGGWPKVAVICSLIGEWATGQRLHIFHTNVCQTRFHFT